MKSQREQLLEVLEHCDFVFFDSKHTVGRWWDTLSQLLVEQRIRIELREIDEQYSRLEIRRKQ